MITRTNTNQPIDDFEFIADQRKFVKMRKGCYSYFERPNKHSSYKCTQITVLVNESKKTWKAFINGKRIPKVHITENERIPSILTVADFDSLLEQLSLIKDRSSKFWEKAMSG